MAIRRSFFLDLGPTKKALIADRRGMNRIERIQKMEEIEREVLAWESPLARKLAMKAVRSAVELMDFLYRENKSKDGDDSFTIEDAHFDTFRASVEAINGLFFMGCLIEKFPARFAENEHVATQAEEIIADGLGDFSDIGIISIHNVVVVPDCEDDPRKGLKKAAAEIGPHAMQEGVKTVFDALKGLLP